MAYQQWSCVEITCDGCGDDWTGDPEQDSVPHFGSRADAAAYLGSAGWTLIAGGGFVCRVCTQARFCQVLGHTWGDWWQTGPRTTRSGQVWAGRERACTGCGRPDYDPAPPGAGEHAAQLDAAATATGLGGYTDRVCWTLTCDDCGGGWGDDRGSPHLSDQAALAAFARDEAGWTITADGGRAYCPRCTDRRVCVLAGHAWTPWRDAGPYPVAGGQLWVGRTRSCRVCDASTFDPPLRPGNHHRSGRRPTPAVPRPIPGPARPEPGERT